MDELKLDELVADWFEEWGYVLLTVCSAFSIGVSDVYGFPNPSSLRRICNCPRRVWKSRQAILNQTQVAGMSLSGLDML